ncbi:MAG: PCRF domain-containing protein, partial [Clostridia bacterium]|nr:PCRF domain-containing protein [Clostridia bacterium]
MNLFDIARLNNEKEELDAALNAPDAWSDVDKANKLNAKLTAINKKLDGYAAMEDALSDIETLIEMADEEDDESLVPEIQ